MKARARVVAEGDGQGGTRLAGLRSEAPLALRPTPDGLYLVGAAGGPLGGDDLLLEIEVGPGATLTVRTAAASLALPGTGPSRARISATVAAGGELRWLPEPLVAVLGCRHAVETTIDLEGGARLVWREEVVLGRHGEDPGSVVTRTIVDVDGTPLLRHEPALGSGHQSAAGPAVAGEARAVGSVLLAGEQWSGPWDPLVPGGTAAILALDGPGVQVTALAADAPDLRRRLEAGLRAVEGMPGARISRRGARC